MLDKIINELYTYHKAWKWESSYWRKGHSRILAWNNREEYCKLQEAEEAFNLEHCGKKNRYPKGVSFYKRFKLPL